MEIERRMLKMETVRYENSESRPEVTWEDYARAEKFLPHNVRKLAFRLSITPNWVGGTDSFWYKVDTREGKKFMFVDPDSGTQQEAFDHVRLAAELSRAAKRAYEHTNLPFDRFEYVHDRRAIRFSVGDVLWECDLNTYQLTRSCGESKRDPKEVVSPDNNWAAFVKNHNLYVRNIVTGEEIQLTVDGQPEYHYAEPLPHPLIEAGLLSPELAEPWLRPAITWSPDSRKILTYKIDHRDVGECYLVQSVPLDGTKRPKLYRYVYPLPGDENVPKAEPFIFDLEKRTQIKVNMEPIQQLYYGAPYVWVYWTKGDEKRIYLLRRERGFTVIKLCVVDPETGDTRVLVEEEDCAGIEYLIPWVINDGREIIWHSQRDGWAHLYLYDGLTGELKNQITSGPWVVREIKHVDENSREVYFTAGGREQGRDPYYRHLYRIKFDGTDLQLLTPEDAEHEITFSPSGRYFVDRYSRVDLAPVTVLRRADGTFVRKLEEADLELLLATGWKFPERFCVKARDGVTDIYGMIIRPSNFDPSKKYPVIEANYSGPQTIRTPKAFASSEGSRQFWHDQAIAELGFIVVTVDGLGMAFRSKAFQDFSYKNLGDGGFEDHIYAFRQLADRYPYMDLSRVGIYGGSAGGYAAAHAILAHPEFYKVAVAWAGNHDHRTDKASWIERYMGLPVGPHYEEQANPTLARNLRGKLLLMHGDMDENVPPAATLQLVDALVKANKDFDFLILPNGVHASGFHPYVTRKRWDYFVEHLLGATPPKEYSIKE